MDKKFGNAPVTGKKPANLSLPHPDFPSLPRSLIYDRVTSMFLDCWDDAEIAEALAEEMNRPLPAHMITGLREEAAMAAKSQPMEIRRRWIYRYSHLSINNLVKEYMYLEGKTDFLSAKREFAEDIDDLVRESKSDHLCIAVNDALGRNNIGLDLIRELQDYARVANKLDALIKPYAETRGITVQKAIALVAERVNSAFKTLWERNMAKAIEALAQLLSLESGRVDAADVEFLLDYSRINRDDSSDETLTQAVDGARAMTRGASALSKALSGEGHHISQSELINLLDRIRGSAVLQREELEQLHKYATRHLKDLETLREIRQKKTKREEDSPQVTTLTQMLAVVKQHLSLVDGGSFFTTKDKRDAKRADISENDLSAILDRLNNQVTKDSVKSLAESLLSGRKFDFPMNRYMTCRFKA